jgi:hypothetical protein
MTPEFIQSDELMRIAVHEAGHVLGCRLAGVKIKEATIVPKGLCNGYVKPADPFRGEDFLRNDAICNLLGHAAELEFGITWGYGHYKDYERATKQIKESLKWQRSDAWAVAHRYWRDKYEDGKWVGKVVGEPAYLYERDQFNLNADYRDWRRATRIFKKEWQPEFNRLRSKARRLAKKHHQYLLTVANLLLEHKSLSDGEIPQLAKAAAGGAQ